MVQEDKEEAERAERREEGTTKRRGRYRGREKGTDK